MTAPDLEAVLAEERRIMEAWAPTYDRATLSNAYVYRLEREAFADWVVSELRTGGLEPASASVLDAGCGTGAVIEMLAERGVGRLTGFDLSPAMLAQVREKRIPGASWVEGTIERPPLNGKQFDAVLACFTLHHLLDRLVYLSAGLSLILAFIGVKLILHFLHDLDEAFPEISIGLSLAVIVAILAVTTVASLIKARRDPTARAHAGSLRRHEPEPAKRG